MTRHEHVAGLDDVRLQHPDYGFPLRGRSGHPVAVAEGEPRGGDRDDPMRSKARGRARNHYCVTDVRAARGQPVTLLMQVALHAARAWRVHHGGVDQVETHATRCTKMWSFCRVESYQILRARVGDVEHSPPPSCLDPGLTNGGGIWFLAVCAAGGLAQGRLVRPTCALVGQSALGWLCPAARTNCTNSARIP